MTGFANYPTLDGTDDSQEATVRVVPGRGPGVNEVVERVFESPTPYDHPGEATEATMTEAQAALIQILEKAEAAATGAKTQAEVALDWLEIVKAPSNRTLPTLLQQLVEEIREVRRMRV